MRHTNNITKVPYRHCEMYGRDKNGKETRRIEIANESPIKEGNIKLLKVKEGPVSHMFNVCSVQIRKNS